MTDSPSVRRLTAVDVRSMVAWISGIPFEAWPQQTRLADGQLRPAMVNDYGWCPPGARGKRLKDAARDTLVLADIGEAIRRDVPGDLEFRNFMLSAVMPQHSIEPHADAQPDGWLIRVHIPLLTNRWAFFDVLEPERRRYQMEVGYAYLVDVKRLHEVSNNGRTPRVHFMFDVFSIG